MTEKAQKGSDDLKARLAGAGLLAAGGLLFKLGFLDVLREAEANASSVSTSTKSVLIAPALAVFGLLLVIIGAPGDGSSGLGRHFVRAEDKRLKPLGWLVAVAALVPGLVLWVWLSARLRELGYGD